jgi:hypothetical protein
MAATRKVKSTTRTLDAALAWKLCAYAGGKGLLAKKNYRGLTESAS